MLSGKLGLPFVYSMHDLKEAVSALIYTLTAKDNKVWANIQLTLLQINLETALGKFDSIKRFCQFVFQNECNSFLCCQQGLNACFPTSSPAPSVLLFKTSCQLDSKVSNRSDFNF